MSDFLAPATNPYVDPQAATFLQSLGTLLNGEDITQLSLAEFRKLVNEAQSSQPKPTGISIAHHEAKTSHGSVDVAICRPKSAVGEHLPFVYYIHGGGWISGNAIDFQPIVVDIVERTQCAVVFPSYTLAPAEKFPVQQEQCLEALQHVVEAQDEYRLDTRKIAVASDSAGCQLACAISILNHRQKLNLPIVHQVLLHPFLDSSAIDTRFSEYYFQNGPFVTNGLVKELVNFYYDDPCIDTKDITASPLLMTTLEAKAYMPPTTIVVGQVEWFRDQAYDFMKLLQTAGVACGGLETFASIHDAEVFVGARDSPTAELSMIAVTGKLREMLAQTTKPSPRKRARAE